MEVPEAIQERLARACAALRVKYNIPHEELTDFVMDITTILSDYFDWGSKTTPKEQ